MQKLFVMVPTYGLSQEDIQKEQREIYEAINENLEKKFELIEIFSDNENYSPLECLGENLKRIAKADYIAFSNGWEKDRDCNIVKTCAKAYGISFINVQIKWLFTVQ